MPTTSYNEPMKNNNQATRKLLITSAAIDFGLGLLKILFGMLSNSYALVIDGIHSLSDLLTDIMVWFFNDIGNQGPDKNHPYGHARYETFGTLLLGSLLIALALFLVYDAAARLLTLDEYTLPGWPALLVVIISIACKEWLYQVTLKQGKATNSRLLQANAWHHRTDSLSSIIVLIGISGAMLGFFWLELLAAIGVSAMIALIGWTLARQSVSELVDTALSDSYVDEIKTHIYKVGGVLGVHNIRTRSMGAGALVDVHLQVSPVISVSEGHQIGEWVIQQLLSNFSEVKDVIVHIDSEDDEDFDPAMAANLAPLRPEVKQHLSAVWEEILPEKDIDKMTLHYLNNQIQVELFLSTANHYAEPQALRQKLVDAAKHLPWLQQVVLWHE
ncbi:MAG: cation diffusion facilitator family transporter [Pseudomonadales bacterium]|nr:cation diffusion facilitator family transporter [Pseudomonadales bacterium]